MIRLRTLGVVEVAHDSGEVIETLVSQPKRLAFLVYLALASPRGFHRRDRLVALFWPELDDERARAALRRSLHFLRSALGTDALVSRGDEVAVDTQVLESDVGELETALAEGRLADAVALYRGDFLSGLHVKGASELDQWMEATRDSLRERVAAACWELADQSAHSSPGDAAAWSARACALVPYDEGALRRRLQLLHDVGDNAAALRAYKEFAEWLEREFGAAPADATRAVADACRMAPAVREARGALVVALADNATTSSAPTGVADADMRLHRTRPSRWTMAVAAAVLAVCVAVAALVLRQPASSSGSPSAPDRIVVIPFAIEGTGPFGYLRFGLVDLLSGTLDGSGPLRAVDPHAVFAYTSTLGADSASATLGQRVAEKFGARYFVSGRVLQSGRRVNVTAGIFEVSGKEVASTHTSGDESMLFAMVDTLTRQLLVQRFGDPGARLMRLAFATTASLPALKAYISGTHELRLGLFSEATVHFTDAVAIDSAFALAHFGRSVAIAWSSAGRDHEAVVAARRAVDHSARLPAHDQALMLAHWEQWAGREQSAEERLRRLLDTYPSDLDAWHELAEVRFHSPATIGVPFTNARAAFEHALDAPSLAPSARVHLARIAAFETDTESTKRLAAVESNASPDDTRAEEILLLDAAVRSDDAAAQPIISALSRGDAHRIWTAAWSVAQYAGNWRMAEQIALFLTRADHSDDARSAGWVAVAQFRRASGRPRAAEDAVLSLQRSAPMFALVLRAGFAALPHTGASDPDEIDAAIRQLRGNAAGDASPDSLSLLSFVGNAAGMRLVLLERLERSRVGMAAPVRGRDGSRPGADGYIQAIFPMGAATRMDVALAAVAERRWADADRLLQLVSQPDRFDVALMTAAVRARVTTATALRDTASATHARARLAWLERDAEPAVVVRRRPRATATDAGTP